MTALRLSAITLILTSVLLSACQSTPQLPDNIKQQQKALARLSSWQAEGKIAINMRGERQSASFDWQQQRNNYVIHLFGPFGQGATWLKRTSRSVTLENAETGTRRANTAEELMEQTLGWQVPVSNLQHWIRGLAAPTPKPSRLINDETGLIATLEQEGWLVDYVRYENHEGWALPGKLTAKRDGIEVTIVVKRWQLASAPAFRL